MVSTRRSGSGKATEIREAKSPAAVKKKQKNHHLSPHTAPQLQSTHLQAGNILSDVLKHHGRSRISQTYERGPRRTARRAIDIDNLTHIDNPISFTQSPKDKNPVMHQEATPVPMHTDADVDTSGTDMGPTTADVATTSADYVASNANQNHIQEEVGTDSVRNSCQPTQSLNLTEIAEKMNLDDETEVDSRACANSLISVRGYKIKPQYVDLLTSILSKYGDIAVKCSDKPVSIRSFYVEYPCIVLEKLENTEFVDLTRSEIDDMLASLSILEGEQVNVGWLKERVQMLYEANLAVSVLRSSTMKQRIADRNSKIVRLEEELKAWNHDYAVKQAELADLGKKICAANEVLAEEKEEVKATKAMMSEYKAKLKSVIQLKSLAESLT